MELDYKAIGARIKAARTNAKMTQEQLCNALSITSVSHISNIERGTTKVSLTTIVNIANALSVTADDILCDNVVKATVQIKRDIAQLVDDCDDYEIRIIKDMIAATKATIRRDKNLRSSND